MMGRHTQPGPPIASGAGTSSRKESRPSTPAGHVGDWDVDIDHSHNSLNSLESDATPRPTPITPGYTLAQDLNSYTSSIAADAVLPPASKRLGFFADKLSAATQSQSHNAPSSGHRASPVPFHSGLGIPPRSHSRTDSGPWEPSAMASSSSNSNVNKVHTSPSKVNIKILVFCLSVLTSGLDNW